MNTNASPQAPTLQRGLQNCCVYAGDAARAGWKVAPAHGLCMISVHYPPQVRSKCVHVYCEHMLEVFFRIHEIRPQYALDIYVWRDNRSSGVDASFRMMLRGVIATTKIGHLRR